MKLLFILLILIPILISIADAASKSKNANTKITKTPINYRRNTFRAVVSKDEEDDDDDDDDLDDEDDDDDDDLDDSNNAPDFNEIFPNPDGRPAGPNGYGAFLKHMPTAQQTQQLQKQHQQPGTPVRRAEPEPIYHNDDAPLPSRRRPPHRNYQPPDYQDDEPPPRRQQHHSGNKEQVHHSGNGEQVFYGPPQRGDGQVFHGPPLRGDPHGDYHHGGRANFYPEVKLLPQGGEGTPLWDYPSKGRSELFEEEVDQPELSRSLIASESEEVVEPVVKLERVSSKPQTMYNRPGYGSSLRPGFGINRYYRPMTQDTRYFRPITNRIYTDYMHSPQGAFAMNGYRPSYRPRFDGSLEDVPVLSRRSSAAPVYPGPLFQGRTQRLYNPWSTSPFRGNNYNPEFVINPYEMLSRRKFRYHSSQKMPVQQIPLYAGYYGNPRPSYVDQWAG